MELQGRVLIRNKAFFLYLIQRRFGLSIAFTDIKDLGHFRKEGRLLTKKKSGAAVDRKRAIDRIITAFELGRKVFQVRDYRSYQGQARDVSK